ncbi:MAG: mercuric transporter MerT family protein [Dehalococcoidia bacterium]
MSRRSGQREGVQGGGLLALGGTSAILASACCILPLVLVMLGLGGAWLSVLHALQPYRWIFLSLTAIALVFAWRRLYPASVECAPGDACALPANRRAYRMLFWIIVVLVALAAVFPWLAPLWY